MKNLFLMTIIFIVAFSCEKSIINKEDLQGSWKLEILEEAKSENENFVDIDDFFSYRMGMAFSGDSLDFFNGFYELDSNKKLKYVGNFTNYKIKKNKLYIDKAFFKNEKMVWNITKATTDTIFFESEDGKFYLKKLHLDSEKKDEFDKIIYSSTGCYGTCPIFNISIDNQGNVTFYGEGYTNPIGIYQSKAGSTQTQFIFEKFRNANPKNLEDKYFEYVTDMATYTTTFVKNGKIVKTIFDYGYSDDVPNELMWAYVPLRNLNQSLHFNKINNRHLPSTPELEIIKIIDETNNRLILEKSEGFLFWTELMKSEITEKSFSPKYEIQLMDGFNYVGPKLESKTNMNLKKLISDGRYYKFEFNDGTSKTFDLGYNFIERNFSETDFHSKSED
jgi:hypothetical protein